jgi:hypothetical protein
VRSVGCGLLLLSLLTFPAAGQSPGTAPWPSLDEARNASACDTTRWAKTIAEIKAAEPERDAEQQVTGGNISLKRLKGPRSEVGTSNESQFIVVETYVDSPSLGIRAGRTLVGRNLPPGVVCHPNVPVAEAFPIVDYVEDKATDAFDKRCGRAVLVLAGDYLRRFNQRVIGLPAYPHKDLCWVAGDKSERRSIAYRPSADLIPKNIPDVATAARFGLTDRVAQLVADGADVAQTDMFGFDALRWAVVRDYRPILDLLIAAGGKPDFCAALEGAVAFARVEAIATLAGRCASQERRLGLLIQAMNNGSDPSPFLLYISGGSEPAVRALLEAQPAPSLSGSKEVASALLATRLDFARLVLDRAAAEPSRVGEWWDGLLGRALAVWRPDLVELLLERGARAGPEAVPYAVERKALDLVQLLAGHGVDLNQGRPKLPSTVRMDFGPDPLGRAACSTPYRRAQSRSADLPRA